jgi:hypothetical protein
MRTLILSVLLIGCVHTPQVSRTQVECDKKRNECIEGYYTYINQERSVCDENCSFEHWKARCNMQYAACKTQ